MKMTDVSIFGFVIHQFSKLYSYCTYTCITLSAIGILIEARDKCNEDMHKLRDLFEYIIVTSNSPQGEFWPL